VAAAVICCALANLFLLWFCLAIGDNEPHWAVVITNLGATGLPYRQKRWSFFAYLFCLGCIAAGAVDPNARILIAWPLDAKQFTQTAHDLWWAKFLASLVQVRLGKKKTASSFDEVENDGRGNIAADKQD